MDWKNLSTTKINKVYYSLFLNHCYICNAKSKTPFCQFCSLGLPNNSSTCTLCKRPTLAIDTICGQCQTSPPPYQTCHAPFRFEGIIKSLIHNVKFNQSNAYLRPLMQLLSDYLIAEYSNHPWPQQLVYVPSHPDRIRERGFCQTKAMTTQLINNLQDQLGDISPRLTKHNPIEKLKHTQAQHALSKKERLANSTNLYSVTGLIAKHIALFDDVMTTGNTIESCTKQLLKAGAEQVDVWVIARTPDKIIR